MFNILSNLLLKKIVLGDIFGTFWRLSYYFLFQFFLHYCESILNWRYFNRNFAKNNLHFNFYLKFWKVKIFIFLSRLINSRSSNHKTSWKFLMIEHFATYGLYIQHIYARAMLTVLKLLRAVSYVAWKNFRLPPKRIPAFLLDGLWNGSLLANPHHMSFNIILNKTFNY